MSKSVPLVLITGFLGAGKTTFINKILDEDHQEKRIGIIQNEFAPANVDGSILRESGKPFEILEINNGSVFCVCLMDDFCNSLRSFIEDKKPDIILLESSGLSDPIAICEILQKPEIRDLVHLRETWTIVDTKNFLKIEKLMTRAVHQLIIADKVILNKTDVSNEKTLFLVKEKITKINPVCDLFESSFCNINFNMLSQNSGLSARAKLKEITSLKAENRITGIQTCVFKSGRKINPDRFKKLLEKYISSALRIKGFILTDSSENMMVQCVYNHMNVSKMEKMMGNTSLIFIGENFNLSEFSNEFRALAR